jgi:predicted tellurium resistance membrane protein TerC
VLASSDGVSALGPVAQPFGLAGLIALISLAALEIVLGIDNIIFIAILSGRLPAAQQARARRLGIGAAVITRIVLLLCLSWVMGLTRPLFAIAGYSFSGKQLILILGGLFLIGKSTFEIHDKLEGTEHGRAAKAASTMLSVIVQIMIVDMVFSLDSVITAVGMAQHIWIMIVAVLLAAAVMMAFATRVSDFVHKHPTIKILALAFLILIGVMLVAEGLGQHVSKGYIYFAMAFSLLVELLNMRMRAKVAPVELRHSLLPDGESA